MIRKVYIDTSVVGGYFDEEFELWTKLFFKSVTKGRFKIAISELLQTELMKAPDEVKHFLATIPNQQKIL